MIPNAPFPCVISTLRVWKFKAFAGLRFEFAFIGVSETWLTDSNHNLFNLSGYTSIEQHRIGNAGGGVGLFLKDHIEYNLIADLLLFWDIMESLFVEYLEQCSEWRKI